VFRLLDRVVAQRKHELANPGKGKAKVKDAKGGSDMLTLSSKIKAARDSLMETHESFARNRSDIGHGLMVKTLAAKSFSRGVLDENLHAAESDGSDESSSDSDQGSSDSSDSETDHSGSGSDKGEKNRSAFEGSQRRKIIAAKKARTKSAPAAKPALARVKREPGTSPAGASPRKRQRTESVSSQGDTSGSEEETQHSIIG
jgi:hypothetical protein